MSNGDERYLSRKWKLAKTTSWQALGVYLSTLAGMTFMLEKEKLPPNIFEGIFSTLNWTWIMVVFGVLAGYGLGNLGEHWIKKNGGN